MASIRQERANAEINKALMDILRFKVNDPRLQSMITITSVNVSPDFRYCKVLISVLDGNISETLKLLRRSEGFIKSELIKIVKMPYAPKIDFALDPGTENSERVNEILKKLNIPKED